MRARTSTLLAAVLSFSAPVFAATFIVPPDERLAQQAPVIVVASPLSSHTQRTERGKIETVTNLSIEDVIKGDVAETLDVVEPGGFYEDDWQILPGVPRFRDGSRYILFLTRSADDRWHVLNFALGKFNLLTDRLGREIAVRDEPSLEYPRDTQHHGEHREAGAFLEFLRTETRGGPAKRNYYVPAEPILSETTSQSTLPHGLRVILTATFTATSYTYIITGAFGARWNVFPSVVTYYSVGTEPGAPGGGATAINAAIGAWNNEPSSNVNYAYGGADPGSHTSGVSVPDGANTIAFERDLSAYGAPPFQCTSNSYNGTLGLGGITKASGTHTGPNSEVFYTALEGDVEMNKGIANCTLLFNNGDFNSAITHELGHTLGFRHSDQTRADNPSIACTTDPTLECSNLAIMKAFIPNGINATLQAWDQHAVAAVYPGGGGGGGVAPAAPTGVNAQATSSTAVLVSWNAVTSATSYEVWRRGTSFTRIATVTTNSYNDTSVAPNTAYLYRVRAVNAVGASPDSASDLATTVIFTDDPLARGVIVKAVHLAELRTAVNAVRALAGLSAATYTDSATGGVIIKAVHITELRTALDAALSVLGFSTGGYTDATLTSVIIKVIHFQEIRNRVK